MSKVVTEETVKEIGDSWFTIKVDGMRDPTGKENISVVIHFVNEKTLEITERQFVMAATDSGDAQSITNIILSELDKAGLSPTKILSQVFDGASVILGRH